MSLEQSGQSRSVLGERRLLRWAGLAGMTGVVMNLLSLIAGLFAPPLFVAAGQGGSCAPACLVDAALPGFPSVKAAIVAENIFYFVAITMFVFFFLGLYRAVKTDSGLAPAMFGTGLALMGLAMEFIGTLTAVAFAHLSEVYQTSGPQDQATLILVSHGPIHFQRDRYDRGLPPSHILRTVRTSNVSRVHRLWQEDWRGHNTAIARRDSWNIRGVDRNGQSERPLLRHPASNPAFRSRCETLQAVKGLTRPVENKGSSDRYATTCDWLSH